jgi:hypothetical protein
MLITRLPKPLDDRFIKPCVIVLATDDAIRKVILEFLLAAVATVPTIANVLFNL